MTQISDVQKNELDLSLQQMKESSDRARQTHQDTMKMLTELQELLIERFQLTSAGNYGEKSKKLSSNIVSEPNLYFSHEYKSPPASPYVFHTPEPPQMQSAHQLYTSTDSVAHVFDKSSNRESVLTSSISPLSVAHVSPYVHSMDNIFQSFDNICEANSYVLVLPIFDGNDPRKWILKARNYFEFKNEVDADKIRLAGLHFEGRAHTWYRWFYETRKKKMDWKVFLHDLLVRFDDYEVDMCHFVNPLNNQQRNSVDQYETEFSETKEIAEYVYDFVFSEEILAHNFINGLKEEIRETIDLWSLKTLQQAVNWAKFQEHRIEELLLFEATEFEYEILASLHCMFVKTHASSEIARGNVKEDVNVRMGTDYDRVIEEADRDVTILNKTGRVLDNKYYGVQKAKHSSILESFGKLEPQLYTGFRAVDSCEKDEGAQWHISAVSKETTSNINSTSQLTEKDKVVSKLHQNEYGKYIYHNLVLSGSCSFKTIQSEVLSLSVSSSEIEVPITSKKPEVNVLAKEKATSDASTVLYTSKFDASKPSLEASRNLRKCYGDTKSVLRPNISSEMRSLNKEIGKQWHEYDETSRTVQMIYILNWTMQPKAFLETIVVLMVPGVQLKKGVKIQASQADEGITICRVRNLVKTLNHNSMPSESLNESLATLVDLDYSSEDEDDDWKGTDSSINCSQYQQQSTDSYGFKLSRFKLFFPPALSKVLAVKQMAMAWYKSDNILVFDPEKVTVVNKESIDWYWSAQTLVFDPGDDKCKVNNKFDFSFRTRKFLRVGYYLDMIEKLMIDVILNLLCRLNSDNWAVKHIHRKALFMVFRLIENYTCIVRFCCQYHILKGVLGILNGCAKMIFELDHEYAVNGSAHLGSQSVCCNRSICNLKKKVLYVLAIVITGCLEIFVVKLEVYLRPKDGVVSEMNTRRGFNKLCQVTSIQKLAGPIILILILEDKDNFEREVLL